MIRGGRPVFGKIEKETWPDGRVTWVSTTKMPIKDDAGNIVGTFGISRDVTAQKLAEEERDHYAEQLDSELKLAREVQQAFLPHEYPVPGLNKRAGLHAPIQPSLPPHGRACRRLLRHPRTLRHRGGHLHLRRQLLRVSRRFSATGSFEDDVCLVGIDLKR